MPEAGRADTLVSEILEILTAAQEQGRHGVRVEELLTAAIGTTRTLADELTELQGYIILERDEPELGQMRQARDVWSDIPEDAVHRDVQTLVATSPTLRALHRAAVETRSVFRYSATSLQLAAKLGALAERHPRHVSSLLPRPTDRHPSFRIEADAVTAMTAVIAALSDAGAIRGYQVQAQFTGKDGGVFWRPASYASKFRVPVAWRLMRGEVAPEFRDFLGGHWLNAYAYGIAEDQFTRAGVPFEVYSNVEYLVKADLGGGASDIDVLVRTSDLVLCLECKSGRVLRGGGVSAAEKTVRNAQRLDAALDRMGVDLRREYHLLHLEAEAETSAAIAAAMVDSVVRIRVTTPREIRALIQRVAAGQAAPDGDPEAAGRVASAHT